MQCCFSCGLVICTLSFRGWWYWILIPWVSLCFWFNILWLFSNFHPSLSIQWPPFPLFHVHTQSQLLFISLLSTFSLSDPFNPPFLPTLALFIPPFFFLSWPSCSQPSTLQRVNGLVVLLKQMSAWGQRGDRGHGADKKTRTKRRWTPSAEADVPANSQQLCHSSDIPHGGFSKVKSRAPRGFCRQIMLRFIDADQEGGNHDAMKISPQTSGDVLLTFPRSGPEKCQRFKACCFSATLSWFLSPFLNVRSYFAREVQCLPNVIIISSNNKLLREF